MNVTIRVLRQDPEAEDTAPFWQDYSLEIEDNATVLDALIKVREDLDGTLSLRCSCRSSICGSCAMRINGHAGLACKTQAAMVLTAGDIIEVEPAGNMPVIKDLVVNFDLFWDKINAVVPYLQPQGPEPEQEYVVSNESMRHLSSVTACIMCGACVSDCTVMEVDPSFLGPAAHWPRPTALPPTPAMATTEGVSKDRLEQLNGPSGMWDCTRCLECVQVCPKGVAPMERIMTLRDQAIAAGIRNTNGARHTEAFSESVEQTGTLDELKLIPKSLGMTNVQGLLNYAPVALQALTHGKMPPLLHKKIDGIENVRRIFETGGRDGTLGSDVPLPANWRYRPIP